MTPVDQTLMAPSNGASVEFDASGSFLSLTFTPLVVSLSALKRMLAQSLRVDVDSSMDESLSTAMGSE
jgi:hypothetical protein